MITRFVKMTFQADKCAEFESIFEASRSKISNFEGCSGVTLYRDHDEPTIYFTFSTWENVESLEKYRQSSLFKDTWQKTKPLFQAKAEAWTVDRLLI